MSTPQQSEERFQRPTLQPASTDVDLPDPSPQQSRPDLNANGFVTRESKQKEEVEALPVPKKYFHVVAHLFGGGAEPQGRVRMNDVIGLLECAGWFAEWQGGSAVKVYKDVEEGPRKESCVIHSHHPASHFRKKQLDRIGWRLRKWFKLDHRNFRSKVVK